MAGGSFIRAENKADRYWAQRFPELTPAEVESHKARNEAFIRAGMKVDAIIAQTLSGNGLGASYSIIYRRAGMKLCRLVEKRRGDKAAYDKQAVALRKTFLDDISPAPSNAGKAFDTMAAAVFVQVLPLLMIEA